MHHLLGRGSWCAIQLSILAPAGLALFRDQTPDDGGGNNPIVWAMGSEIKSSCHDLRGKLCCNRARRHAHRNRRLTGPEPAVRGLLAPLGEGSGRGSSKIPRYIGWNAATWLPGNPALGMRFVQLLAGPVLLILPINQIDGNRPRMQREEVLVRSKERIKRSQRSTYHFGRGSGYHRCWPGYASKTASIRCYDGCGEQDHADDDRAGRRADETG